MTYEGSLEPTKITYSGFIEAYDYFNDRLFDNRLPRFIREFLGLVR